MQLWEVFVDSSFLELTQGLALGKKRLNSRLVSSMSQSKSYTTLVPTTQLITSKANVNPRQGKGWNQIKSSRSVVKILCYWHSRFSRQAPQPINAFPGAQRSMKRIKSTSFALWQSSVNSTKGVIFRWHLETTKWRLKCLNTARVKNVPLF